ncbi:hypothetical protein GCM10009798_09140 [Nocardioides panacihumi]|uniref:Lipoprotein n=1 Tax=Nocardioides panacihumi TaxID=400774 RepID=A0ABP5BX62_9ACTN
MVRRLAAAAALATLATVAAACGSGDADAGDHQTRDAHAAADSSTCVADATAVTSTPPAYPADFPLPKDTVVFNIEDRGADGVIATGVTTTRFDDVLTAMNDSQQAGFKVTSGETEEDDAEANWTGNGFTGRWAIKKSATCPGETVVQLLSKKS